MVTLFRAPSAYLRLLAGKGLVTDFQDINEESDGVNATRKRCGLGGRK
jgi:hypothetical protein